MTSDSGDIGELSPPGTGSGVGTLLRTERERLGKDLGVVARTLKIRASYLEAIEDGRFQDLPGSAYVIGFLRSYSDYLGLDWDEIARRFKNETGGLSGRMELVFPSAVSERNIPTGMLIMGAIVIAILIYGFWYFYQGRESGNDLVASVPDRLAALIHRSSAGTQPGTPASTAAATPPPGDVLPNNVPPVAPSTATPAPQAASNATAPAVSASASAPAAASAAAPAAPAATPAAPPPPVPAPQVTASAPAVTPASAPPPAAPAVPAPAPKPVVAAAPSSPSTDQDGDSRTGAQQQGNSGSTRVMLRASDDCWVQIRDASGALVYSRLLHKGDSYNVPDRKGLTLTAGNAGVLAIVLDGSALPSLGGKGMVRHDVPLDPDQLTKLPPPGQDQQ